LSGSAIARDRYDRDQRSDRTERSDRADRNDLTSNQIIDRFAARTARIKADLRLTPEQDKHWAGFASAMDDMAKKVADRRATRRDEIARERDAAKQNAASNDTPARDNARQAEARQGNVPAGESRPADTTRTGDARSTEVIREDARADRRDRRDRTSDNFLERMRQEATAMSDMAADRKALADAAQPLFDSLDDRQRQRFAEAISNMNRRPDRD
jgi:hypothetical protein